MKILILSFVLLSFFISNQAKAQCSTPSTVPYSEGFQTITVNNQLPSCWAISNSTLCHTSAGNPGFAYFYYQPASTNYFYTNAIQLSAGVVYSISLFYTTGFNSTTTWSDFSLLINSSQNAVGATTIASTNGFAIANGMSALSNTFTVGSSGVYYVAIKGTSNGTGTSQYLSWDDLSITIPCQISPNSPSVAILAPSTVICAGTQETFTATGANSYTWNTGATTSTISSSFIVSSTYSVIGTNSLTGCTSSASINIAVNPAPNILIYSNASSICIGSSINMTAFGASSYSWSSGQQTNSITVSPSVSTIYTVTGSNNLGCISSAVQFIQVNALPIVVAAASTTNACAGDSVALYATGALNYQWIGINSGNVISVIPIATSIYTVLGTNAQSCSSTATVEVQVSECTGISSLINSEKEIKIAPNPFINELLFFSGNTDQKIISLWNLNGRMILQLESKEEQILLNTTNLAQGIYYVKILSGEKTSVLKLIKN